MLGVRYESVLVPRGSRGLICWPSWREGLGHCSRRRSCWWSPSAQIVRPRIHRNRNLLVAPSLGRTPDCKMKYTHVNIGIARLNFRKAQIWIRSRTPVHTKNYSYYLLLHLQSPLTFGSFRCRAYSLLPKTVVTGKNVTVKVKAQSRHHEYAPGNQYWSLIWQELILLTLNPNTNGYSFSVQIFTNASQ